MTALSVHDRRRIRRDEREAGGALQPKSHPILFTEDGTGMALVRRETIDGLEAATVEDQRF